MQRGLKNLEAYLSRHDRFIISTHESSDADGLGAEIAFSELLNHLGKESIILNSDPINEKFTFIDHDSEIQIFSPGYTIDNIEEYAIFVLDTNDFNNIGNAYLFLKDRVKEVFIIDHHEGGKDKFEHNFIKAEASSTCEIIYQILQHYDLDPSFKASQALYAGMLFDTGSFRYPKTSPITFKIASHLVENGASPFKIYEYIYENNSLASFELRGLMLASMEIHHDGRLIMLRLTPDMIKKTGAPFSEGEMNINLPLTVKGVVASLLVKQDIVGPVKVSMRTKGDLDVAEIAMKNGGGGHKNASGYKSPLQFDETCKKALDDMSKFFT
ncbi:MAG: DHH family phosphoesterase [Spirochaetota bacterium]